jgi:hypothetical protein
MDGNFTSASSSSCSTSVYGYDSAIGNGCGLAGSFVVFNITIMEPARPQPSGSVRLFLWDQFMNCSCSIETIENSAFLYSARQVESVSRDISVTGCVKKRIEPNMP